MTVRLSAADIVLLAQASGLRFPEDDLAPLAEAVAAHLAFVESLLLADLDDANPALTLDPRWRD